MTRIVLQGRGYRIHTGKMTKKMYDRLEEESETSADGSVDIWEYIDYNIVHGVDPELFQIVLDDAVVATDLDELVRKFKLVVHPYETLPMHSNRDQNVVLIEFEKGDWGELEVENFQTNLLRFELRTLSLPDDTTHQVLTAYYNDRLIKEPVDLTPKGVRHFHV
jgi:hypothetical protein